MQLLSSVPKSCRNTHSSCSAHRPWRRFETDKQSAEFTTQHHTTAHLPRDRASPGKQLDQETLRCRPINLLIPMQGKSAVSGRRLKQGGKSIREPIQGWTFPHRIGYFHICD
jgi:hypothetical protein